MTPQQNSPHQSAQEPYRILCINPGSTSTKVAVFSDTEPILCETIRHTPDDLRPFRLLTEQHTFRRDIVLHLLQREQIPLHFDAVIGRGGFFKPMPAGVYEVNDRMCRDVRQTTHRHACNLGCLIAREIAESVGGECRAYIADPVTVDEMVPEAHVSGSPLLPRIAIWHALNQRAIARRYAHEHGKRYEQLNLIICHLGGGISVAAHEKGRAVDVNNALDGEGPFSPERAGTLPAAELIRLCFSHRFSEEQLTKRIAGEAGLMAHLGTTDIPRLTSLIEQGDTHARQIVDAMIFHIAKSIASESAVLRGAIDAIILTGGMAHEEYITQRIAERVGFLAPIAIYPGEDEMEALALNALSVLRGEQTVKEYF